MNRNKEQNTNYWIGFLESAIKLNHDVPINEILLFILNKIDKYEEDKFAKLLEERRKGPFISHEEAWGEK
jgi:hypothetical protein